jgi:hypothetical protein
MCANTRKPLARVERWAAEERKARRLKEKAICDAKAAGATVRAIGDAAGMDHVAVWRLLERRKEEE